jgi:hypothetical protein
MKSSRTTRSRQRALISSVGFWAAALLLPALLGFLLAADSVSSPMPLAAILAVTAGVSSIRQSRVRARKRLQTALDAYAEREIAHASQFQNR